ncbi:hypothetical protein TKK_0018508 [Trichogramma kaykai]|uniref:Carbonic anhydrase n=1 Tax=Trichogramma kaykai TaxID=54128 RepID=A0ABD2VY61_9HYME
MEISLRLGRWLMVMSLALTLIIGSNHAMRLPRLAREDEDGSLQSIEEDILEEEESSTEETSHDANGRGQHFDYKKSDEWPNEYPICAGDRQSPVNIELHHVRSMEPGRPPLGRFGYDKKPTRMKIVNNGHTVQLSGEWPAKDTPTIYGGPLTGLYELAQIHFHWGPDNTAGSEHTVANQSFPLEMHLVHWKKSYENISEAMLHDDGLAVIGYLMSVDKNPNTGLERMRASFNKILRPQQTTEIEPFPLTLFDLDLLKEGYVTYVGSLTTPPCNESAIWLLSVRIKDVTMDEMDSFRKLRMENHNEHNYRRVQPLNGRSITYYYDIFGIH